MSPTTFARFGNRVVVTGAALALVAAGCGGGAGGDSSRAETTVHAVDGPEDRPGGRFVDVGGYRVFLQCTGEGSPTVVLEAGAGIDSSDWEPIQTDVARFTRACSYDRPGLGLSEEAPDDGELDDEDVAEQLHLLLDEAGVEPPLVLVGHSMGGLYARLYEQAYPGEAVGMVLVDSVGGSAVPLGGRPLVVLAAGESREGAADPWTEDQRQLAGLSSNSTFVGATKSGHFIERDQPDLVVEAIRQVVEAARDDSPLPPCEETFPRFEGECVGE